MGTGEDVLFLYLDPQTLQLDGDIAPAASAIVGQEAEGHLRRPQFVNEPIRSGDHQVAAVDHPVHVDQVAEHSLSPPVAELSLVPDKLGEEARHGRVRARTYQAIWMPTGPPRR